MSSAERRLANFAVRTEATRDPDLPDERTIYVTYNGRQEYPIQLAPHEARQLFDLLRSEFNL